jgi:hypothetical protein
MAVMCLTGARSPPAAARHRDCRLPDTGESWLVRVGQFTGTDPDDQARYDQPSIQVTSAAGTGTAASVCGTAADLDCWLWRRPPLMPLGRSGDPAVLSAFDSMIASGIT